MQEVLQGLVSNVQALEAMLEVSPTDHNEEPPWESSRRNSVLLDMDKDDFICPVCTDLMCGLIVQCGEGQAMCETCANTLQLPASCPICRQPCPGGQFIRNRMLESLVSKLTFSCGFGCR